MVQSHLAEVDFDNLPFGKVFSDHIFVADYIDGQWKNASILPYAKMEFHPGLIALHYGQSIFEGLKAYRNDEGTAVLFRPMENAVRFARSAERMCMPVFPVDQFVHAISELVKMDEGWIPAFEKGSLYIRPVMFGADEFIGVHPSKAYKLIIFTCPSGVYFNRPVSVKIETHFARASEGGIGFAKAAANYAAGLYPTQLAMRDGYDQLIWTDARDHETIEEAGTMNVFFRIGDTLVTPHTHSTILDGITRKSILTLCKDLSIPVEERSIKVDELLHAADSGQLLEAFGTGTAATISVIAKIGFKGFDFSLPALETGKSYAEMLLERLNAIRRGIEQDDHQWMVKIH